MPEKLGSVAAVAAADRAPDIPAGWIPALRQGTLVRELRAARSTPEEPDSRRMAPSWMWNARVRGGPVALGPVATRLVGSLDGRRSWAEAVRASGLLPERAAAVLETLVGRGLVVPWPGRPPFPKRGVKRRLGLWWHVTSACNLACPHCYIERVSGPAADMSDDVASRGLRLLVETCRKRGIEAVDVKMAGGEPLLRRRWLERTAPRWRDTLLAIGVEPRFAVLTNGTCLDRGAVRFLRDLPASVSVSLDGVGRVHDAMRPGPRGIASFERVRQGLWRALDAGLRPYVLVTLSARNAEGLAELGDFLLDMGLAFRVSLGRDLRRGGRCGEDGVLVSALSELYRVIEARIPLPYRVLEKHRLCDLSPLRPIRRACGAGETHVAFGRDGRVAACQALLETEGRMPVESQDLVECARDPRLERPDPCQDCRECPYHEACAGGCPLLLVRRAEAEDRGQPPGNAVQPNGASPYCAVFRALLPRLLELGALDAARRGECLP